MRRKDPEAHIAMHGSPYPRWALKRASYSREREPMFKFHLCS